MKTQKQQPRSQAKRKAPLASPKKAPAPRAAHSRADAYHEIEQGDGVLCVNPGDYIVRDGDAVTVMPPERYNEAFPDRAAG